jgi:uncharacterized protein YqhQ
LRGIYNLYETLKIGIKTLNYSADIAVEAEKEKISTVELVFSFLFAFVVGIGLFVVLPLYLTDLFGIGNYMAYNIVDGIIKILFFVCYVIFISFFKDIRRIFEYHGAEHKVVNCYESTGEFDYEKIKQFSTLHLRCGTNFVFLVLFFSIFFFVLIPKDTSLFFKICSRIVLIPAIASFSYEIIKLFNKFPNNIFLKSLVVPGLLLQKITTKEPDEKQIEVAVASAKLLVEELDKNLEVEKC